MKFLLLLFFTVGCFNSAQAQDKKDDLSLEYPELMVTPKASKRLFMEAKREKEGHSNPLSTHSSIELSGLMTLIASTTLKNKPRIKNGVASDVTAAAQAGTMVGAAWLITGLTLHYIYKPNVAGYAYIKKLPNKTKRDKLFRERIAEEQLRKAAEHGKKIAWFSFATNFGASAYMLSLGNPDANLISGGALLLSFLPFMYPYQWETVYDSHQQYKKKIYGPIAYTGFVMDRVSKKAVPSVNVSWNF